MKSGYKGYYILFLFYAITLFFDIQANKFQLVDFEVYYKAASRFFNHIHLYQHTEDGHYLFKYSPVFAMCMIPFQLVNFELAKWIYLSIIFIANSLIFYFLRIEFKIKLKFLHVFIIVLIFSKHLNKEIVLGQINILLLFFLLTTIYFINSKPKISSLFLTLSLFIKPVGLILVLYIVLKKKFSILNYLIGYSLFLIALSFCFVDIDSYRFWFIEIKNELLAKADLVNIDTQTIFALLRRILGIKGVSNTLIGLTIWSILISYIYRLKSRYFPYILVSSIPLLVCTSNNFYLLSLPLFFYLLTKFSEFNLKLKIGFLISSLLISINQYELWGRTGVDLIDKYTPYCFSVLISIVVFLKFIKSQKHETE